MKISELVNFLNDIKSKNGDLFIMEVSLLADNISDAYIEADNENGETFFYSIKNEVKNND